MAKFSKIVFILLFVIFILNLGINVSFCANTIDTDVSNEIEEEDESSSSTSTVVSGITHSEGLTVSDIINIILITVGILLIILGITILIKLK